MRRRPKPHVDRLLVCLLFAIAYVLTALAALALDVDPETVGWASAGFAVYCGWLALSR